MAAEKEMYQGFGDHLAQANQQTYQQVHQNAHFQHLLQTLGLVESKVQRDIDQSEERYNLGANPAHRLQNDKIRNSALENDAGQMVRERSSNQSKENEDGGEAPGIQNPSSLPTRLAGSKRRGSKLFEESLHDEMKLRSGTDSDTNEDMIL